MTSLLEQIQPTEEQNKEALARALEETLNDQMKTRQAQEAAEAAVIAEAAKKRVEKDLGYIPQPIEPASIAKNTLQALEKLKPEAKQHYLQQIIAQHYGIETKIQTEETIPYQTLEERVQQQQKQTELYRKLINGHNPKINEGIKPLKLSSQISLTDKTDTEIYLSAMKRIDKALNKKSLSSLECYVESIGTKAMCAATTTTFAALFGSFYFLVDSAPLNVLFVCLSPFVPMIFGPYAIKRLLLGPKHRASQTYRESLAKHFQKQGQTLEQDIDIATEYAQKLQGQLKNPTEINKRYSNSLELVTGTKSLTEAYLKDSLKELEDLKRILK